jgi:hypothetical protein
MKNTIPYYLAGEAVGQIFGIEPLKKIPLEIIESHLIAGGIRNASKLFIGRRREFEGKGPYFFEFNGGTSFPSGHTSVMFEVATIASHHAHNRLVSVFFYSLATLEGSQRIDSSAHWPSDVFLSAVLGSLVARAVVHRNAERHGKDVPVIGLVPTANGAALTLRF